MSLIHSKWSKERFLKTKLLHNTSRHLIAISINYLLERDQRKLNEQNETICQSIEQIDEHLDALGEKFNTLNNICHFLRIPSRVYLEKRMVRLRQVAKEYLDAIEEEIRDEIDHWNNIQSIISQPLLETGLIRSYYGGLPRQVQQSPSSELNTIYEANETVRSIRSLAPISPFSILSNTMMDDDNDLGSKRFNKTFVKTKSTVNDSLFEDENITSIKLHKKLSSYRSKLNLENDTREEFIICID
ncbi:unnamed protein product [Adineta ricciae]|uniref:Uncharacterized protein n=1 Tax=Adineta ricciae TaxID=249248 RepID=A0A814JSG3_ADIRI|nr:unnamed protein product [Adineta ricciae]CAF1060025.1 unnamed protein product [Adineta ricciae]